MHHPPKWLLDMQNKRNMHISDRRRQFLLQSTALILDVSLNFERSTTERQKQSDAVLYKALSLYLDFGGGETTG